MVYQVSWNLPGNFLHFHHTTIHQHWLARSDWAMQHAIAELQMLLCMTSRPTMHFGQPEA